MFYYSNLRTGNKSVSWKILINFCVALLLTYVVFCFGIDRVSNRILCIWVASLLQFLCLSSLAWIGIEAYLIYCKVTDVSYVANKYFVLKVTVVGWGESLSL